MKAINTIRQLIQEMTSQEKKVLRSYLTSFSSKGSKSINYSLKLFELLDKHPDQPFTDRQLETLIYGKSTGRTFPQLVLRLREKIVESLILPINIEREGSYSERGKALLQIRNELSQAQILITRGQKEWAIQSLQTCIEKAKKYEHYEEWLVALRMIMQVSSFDKGLSVFEASENEYNKALRGLQGTRKGLEYYTRLIAHLEFSSENIPDQVLEQQIESLQYDLKASSSANVALYLHYLESHLFQQQGRYRAASVSLRQLCDLTENHPALASKTQLIGVLINRSWNFIYLRRFEDSLKYAEKAASLIPANNIQTVPLYETYFYSHFYSQNYLEAIKYLVKLLALPPIYSKQFSTGKWLYLKACTKFMTREFQESHLILMELNPIESDIQGWNICLRLLHIMIDIELERIENAVKRIENLRKHIDKTKRTNNVSKRYEVIFDVLRTLINTRIDFIETYKRKKQLIEHLKDNRSEIKWTILTPELIIFDQWFESKVFRKNFILQPTVYKENQVLIPKF
jgi:tetratricopeptide (TPR) repeat protein